MGSDLRQELMRLVYEGALSAEAAASILTAGQAEASAGAQRPEPSEQTDIAVIGMSGRFPGASNVDEYWDLLRTNRSAIVDVEGRWPEINGLYSADLADVARCHCRWGGLMPEIFDFDPLFFELSPRQGQLMEPRQRLLLMESWRALEDAGYSRGELDGRSCGIFIGSEGSSEYFDRMDRTKMDGNAVLGRSNAVMSARIAYLMNLRGPCVTIDTACSSSLVAIHTACQSLLDGSSDIALAGGVSVMLSVGQQLLQSGMGMLSPTGACRTFDESADGFAPAECVAVLVLKRLGDARRDKDHVYAVICGGAVNQDGKTNGITAPSAQSQQALIERVRTLTGPGHHALRYVEAHGTGTPLGDPIEVDALIRTYGAWGHEGATAIGSVKSNIGHAGAAAGVAAVIKLLLAARHGTVPASLNFRNLNHRIDLDGSALYVATRNEPLFRGGEEEALLAVSSFGYSGTNAHLVLSAQRAVRATAAHDPLDLAVPLFLSAATRAGLERQGRAYQDWVVEHGEGLDPLELSLQSLALRTPLRYRTTVPFTSLPELAQRLATVDGQGATGASIRDDRATTARIDAASADRAQLAHLLRDLAQPFEGGSSAPFWRLAAQVGERLSLPTYRFEQRLYVLDEADLAQDVPVGAAPVEAASRRKSEREAYVVTYSGDEPFLRDHSNVLPGVIYMELFRQAAIALAGDGRAVGLADVSWHRLLHAPQGRRTTVTIEVPGRSAEELSLSLVSGGETYATARAVLGVPGLSDELKDDPGYDHLPHGFRAVQDYRALLTRHGIGVGETFTAATGLCYDGARMEAVLRPGLRADGTIDPSGVDAGFSSVAAWVCHAHEGVDGLYVPYALGAVEWGTMDRPLSRIRARRTREAMNGDIQTATYDLAYLDDRGRVALTMRNLVLRRRFEDAPAAGSDGEVVALVEDWQEAPASQDTGSLPVGLARTAEEARVMREALAGRDHLIVLVGSWPEPPRPGEERLKSLEDSSVVALAKRQGLSSRPTRWLMLGSDEVALDLLHLVRGLLKCPVNQSVDLVLLTEDDPKVRALSGLLRCLALEKPAYSGRLVVGPLTDPATTVRREAELASTSAEARLTGHGTREELALAPVDLVEPSHAYVASGVFLVTGGAGGVGLTLTRHLLAHQARRVWICGRSELSVDRAGRVAELGERVRYVRCDLTDPAAVERLVAAVKETGDSLTGVFHAAGVIRDKVLLAKDDAAFAAVTAPKIAGGTATVGLARRLGASLVVLFSSTSAVLGNPGQADYAYGNRFLDLLAEQHADAGGLRVFSLNWSVWAEGGMSIPEPQLAVLRERFGLIPLPNGAAFDAMDACIESDLRRCVVMHGLRPQILAKVAARSDVGSRSGASPLGERVAERLERVLRDVVCEILHLDSDQVDFDDDLARYGFDSISFAELARRLNETVGLQLTPAVFFGYTYLHELRDGLLADHGADIAARFAEEESPGGADERPTSAEVVATTPSSLLSAGSAPGPQVGQGYCPVAIVGMSGRFPRSDDIEEFWEHLRDADDLITEIPADRWDWRAIDGDTELDRRKTRYHHGGFMKQIDEFDPLFFRIAGADAHVMDPQERLMLEESWHALEDAGIDPLSLAGSDTGVFVGVSTGDYKELLIKQAYPAMLTQTMVPNRVSFTLDLHGPSLAVDTACSSTLVAIHQAVEQIQSGRCALALAGGINVICSPDLYITQGRMHMLSPTGSCKTFDAAADGYVRSEGCGVVVLKPLADAEREGDRILGIIRGSATNHGGSASNLFAPNEASQSGVVQAAYQAGRIPASSVSYIETHGTGTPLGDPIEVNALVKAYTGLYQQEGLTFAPTSRRVHLGAVKSNTGHLEAASALPGLAKVLWAFRDGEIPQNLHFHQQNPCLELDRTPFRVLDRTVAWGPASDGAPRRAALSSFGIGGVNAHLVLEEPSAPAKTPGHEGARVLPVSARSLAELVDYVGRLDRQLRSWGTQARPEQNVGATGFLTRLAGLLSFSSAEDLDLDLSLADYGAEAAHHVLSILRLEGAADREITPRSTLRELVALATPASPTSGRDLDGLCRVFQSGRSRFRHRACFVGRDVAELLAQLERFLAASESYDLYGVTGKDWVPAPRLSPRPGEPVGMTQATDLALAWLRGEEPDFGVLHPRGLANVVPAPTYPFHRRRYWYTDLELPDGGADAGPAAPPGAPVSAPEPTTPQPAACAAASDLTDHVTQTVSALLKIPVEEIDPTADLTVYGMDSIRLVSLSKQLSESLGVVCEPALILDHPTVGGLAAAVAGIGAGRLAETPVREHVTVTEAPPAPALPSELPGGGPQLVPGEIQLISAATEFDRDKMVSFWRELKRHCPEHVQSGPVDLAFLAGLQRVGATFLHVLTTNELGQRAEVYLAGQGRPLLMIMGVGMAPAFAAYQIEGMADHRQIVCVSMPGVGLTPPMEDLSLAALANFVLATLDTLGIEELDVMGISWGGMPAVTMAKLQPERIGSLVLVSPNPDMGAVEDPGEYVAGIDDAMHADFAVVPGSEEARDLYDAAQCLELRAFLRWVTYFGSQSPSRHEIRSILGQVAQPALVISGGRDTIILPRAAELVTLSLRNAEHVVIEEAAHLPQVTHPEQVNRLVDDFLCGEATPTQAVLTTGARP